MAELTRAMCDRLADGLPKQAPLPGRGYNPIAMIGWFDLSSRTEPINEHVREDVREYFDRSLFTTGHARSVIKIPEDAVYVELHSIAFPNSLFMRWNNSGRTQ